MEEPNDLDWTETEEPEEEYDGSGILVRDTGVLNDGTPYWLYIAVEASKYKEFMRLSKGRMPLMYEQFGTILRYGYDKEIPVAVCEEMKEEFGFDEDFMTKYETNRLADIVAMLKKQNPSGE